MRRADGLVALSRRQFCGGVATCVGLTLAGCIDGDATIVSTGPLGPEGGTNNNERPDASTTPTPDAGPMATCPTTGATDVGAPSSFTANSPVYFSTGKYFVMRDSGGLYAVSSRCTHEGATCVNQSGQFYCPRHGAKFDYNGGIISGPVSTGLTHYAMCTLANGHVAVIASQPVGKTQRLIA